MKKYLVKYRYRKGNTGDNWETGCRIMEVDPCNLTDEYVSTFLNLGEYSTAYYFTDIVPLS